MNIVVWFKRQEHDYKTPASFCVSSVDQTFGATFGQSQRGRGGAGAQPTAQEQLQGAAQRGETLPETSPLFTGPLPRAGLSAFTGQGRGPPET